MTRYALTYRCRQCQAIWSPHPAFETRQIEHVLSFNRNDPQAGQVQIHACAPGVLGIGELCGAVEDRS